MATGYVDYGTIPVSVEEIEDYLGGRGCVACSATDFASCTISLQYSLDGTNWLQAKDLSGNAVQFTANNMFNVDLPTCKSRMEITGSDPGSITGLLCKLSRTSNNV